MTYWFARKLLVLEWGRTQERQPGGVKTPEVVWWIIVNDQKTKKLQWGGLLIPPKNYQCHLFGEVVVLLQRSADGHCRPQVPFGWQTTTMVCLEPRAGACSCSLPGNVWFFFNFCCFFGCFCPVFDVVWKAWTIFESQYSFVRGLSHEGLDWSGSTMKLRSWCSKHADIRKMWLVAVAVFAAWYLPDSGVPSRKHRKSCLWNQMFPMFPSPKKSFLFGETHWLADSTLVSLIGVFQVQRFHCPHVFHPMTSPATSFFKCRSFFCFFSSNDMLGG